MPGTSTRSGSDARAGIAILLAALGLLGCGEAAPAGQRLVDPRRDPPVNGLEVEPGSGALLLSTNRGLYRIAPGAERAERIRSRVVTAKGSAPVGRQLAIASGGGSLLLGSGHPHTRGRLPSFLGFMTSRDGGRTWRVRSRLGFADLHSIVPAHDRVYALDTVLDGLLVGDARGRRWREHLTPGSRMLDLAVDPGDPAYVLASDRNGIHRSEDEGETWRQIAPGDSPRLAWPAGGPAYRADRDGRVSASDDRGVSWRPTTIVEGRPAWLKALGPRRLLMALDDATVLESADGGESWERRFEP